MKLEITRDGTVLIVRLTGDFDLNMADGCRREIDRQMKEPGLMHILFDLSEVTFIDSSGLGVILGRYRRVSEQGGRVAIVSSTPGINKILELAGLLRLVPVFPDFASALVGLKKEGVR